MTIPDKLVTAAAEAICRACGCGDPTAHASEAEAALAAAFAALPECQEAVDVIGPFVGWPWQREALLAAFAKEFGS